eukprot:1158372-Pelagomonas_calceolata.AAC.2
MAACLTLAPFLCTCAHVPYWCCPLSWSAPANLLLGCMSKRAVKYVCTLSCFWGEKAPSAHSFVFSTISLSLSTTCPKQICCTAPLLPVAEGGGGGAQRCHGSMTFTLTDIPRDAILTHTGRLVVALLQHSDGVMFYMLSVEA